MKTILSCIVLILTGFACYSVGELSDKIGYGLHTWQHWVIALPISMFIGYCGGRLIGEISK